MGGARAVLTPSMFPVYLDRENIRERALALYSTAAIGPQYTKFFERLKVVYPEKFT